MRTLVVLWDTDSTCQFARLYLVAPKSGDARTAESYWQTGSWPDRAAWVRWNHFE
jgi:hypothetical protein